MVLRRIDLSMGEKLLYPSKPIVVTASYDGEVGGMFASWWTQLSFNPFLIGVAIGPERYTYKLARLAGVYGLNLLKFSDVDKAPYLGDVSARFMGDKLKRGGFEIFYGDELGVPMLSSAYLTMEVRLEKTVEVGDHDLFIGEVVSMYAEDIVDDNGMWKLDELKPIFYMGRLRRHGRTYRRFITWSNVEIRDNEYAPAELKGASLRRYRVRRRIFDSLRKYGVLAMEDAIQVVSQILRDEGLDIDDAKYYIEEALRNGIFKLG